MQFHDKFEKTKRTTYVQCTTKVYLSQNQTKLRKIESNKEYIKACVIGYTEMREKI